MRKAFYVALGGLGYVFVRQFASPDMFAPPVAPDSRYTPPYLKLHKTGELKKRADALWETMEKCTLCPRMCKVNRHAGEVGFCGATSQLVISSHHPHFGEERPLVGRGGSGTIFFAHCGLRCIFCINWEISHGGQGSPRTVENLSQMMLSLQKRGCHNINVVTPTHYLPHILRALDSAAERGLHVPLVYNTCGWEHLRILKMLDGVVDIYLPDLKYWDDEMAVKYSSGARGYPQINRDAILEMYRQVGTAQPADDGLIYRGLMVRHLVMPNDVGGTRQIIEWIAQHLPRDTYVNLMSQYQPMYKAFEYSAIARRITAAEYSEAVQCARRAGLTNVDIQGFPGSVF